MCDSLWPHGLQPSRLLCPWYFPGKNPGVGCHLLLQGIFRTQQLNPCLLHLLFGWQVCFFVCFYHWATWEGFRMYTHTLICHILFIIDYKKLSCHGEQYLLSSIINSYWGDSSYKDKFAPSTLKGMIMSQWDYGLDPTIWLCEILYLVFLFRCFSLLFLLCIYHWVPREAHVVSRWRKKLCEGIFMVKKQKHELVLRS